MIQLCYVHPCIHLIDLYKSTCTPGLTSPAAASVKHTLVFASSSQYYLLNTHNVSIQICVLVLVTCTSL